MDTDRKRTVLVVEDDASMQKVLSLSMQKMGHEYAIAKNGLEALDLLESGDVAPDAILLDIRMPVMSGLVALPKIRALLPTVPVIMLTAFGDLETGLAAMKAGAFDYLVKPSSLEKIREALEKAFSYRDIMEMKAEEERNMAQRRLDLEKQVESSYQELGDVYKKLKKINLQTAYALAETIEAKDRYTQGHCERVRWLSSLIGKTMRLPDEEIEQLEYAALLHDIGKIGIPDSILNKEGPLDEKERQIIRMHPIIGAQILSTVEFFKRAATAVRHHHERWDGKGYPDGVEGENIDHLARIIALADTFDAMATSRAYRTALSFGEVVQEIHRMRGTQFAPDVVDVFFAAGLDTTYFKKLQEETNKKKDKS
jgi:putative two-component system response regulator